MVALNGHPFLFWWIGWVYWSGFLPWEYVFPMQSCSRGSKASKCEAVLRKPVMCEETKTVWKLMWDVEKSILHDGHWMESQDKSVLTLLFSDLRIFTWSVFSHKEQNLQDVSYLVFLSNVSLGCVSKTHWLLFNISFVFIMGMESWWFEARLNKCQHSNWIFIERKYV